MYWLLLCTEYARRYGYGTHQAPMNSERPSRTTAHASSWAHPEVVPSAWQRVVERVHVVVREHRAVGGLVGLAECSKLYKVQLARFISFAATRSFSAAARSASAWSACAFIFSAAAVIFSATRVTV